MTKEDIAQIVGAVMQNIAPLVEQQAAAEAGVKKAAAPLRANSIYGERGAQINAAQPAASSERQARPAFARATLGKGVFAEVADAIDAADAAQKILVRDFKLEDRRRMTDAIRRAALEQKETLARMAVEETGLGRYEDKVGKVELTAMKTPGVEVLTTSAQSGDDGLTIEEMAPFGLIGAVSPVTNPMETLLNNAIGMLAGGNAAVFNVHPSGKNVSAYTVNLINEAVLSAGGPENLITMVETPTMDTLKAITESPKVRLLVGTGGPGLVKTLLKSGKKAIGAGAGNPPVIVDEGADLALAAREIIRGAAFDNNILCIAEKEVFVLESAADDFIYELMKQGAYVLTREQAAQVMDFALYRDAKAVSCGCSGPVTGEYHVAKEWVGKDAAKFLQKLGVTGQESARLLVFETDVQNPFVQLEQMMPVLPIVRVKTLDEAIEKAVQTEHGNRHTASMFSRNVEHLTRFARAIGTTIFVKNAATLAGVGFGGEGYTTFTIAGPTGEGITCARTFTRSRRCVLAEGGFRIL